MICMHACMALSLSQDHAHYFLTDTATYVCSAHEIHSMKVSDEKLVKWFSSNNVWYHVF